jgi:di/tricarboxylate transporter
MGRLSRDEWITATVFILMILAWIFAGALKLNLAAVAIAGLGTLLATGVLKLDDIYLQGGTLSTFIWLALLGVFLDVGIKAGVPVHLMGFALLFASSYFSTLTPQGGSQNVIFVAVIT